jgi:hypothetical protein
MHWFIFVLGALATFRISHLVSKERGPLAIFERLRGMMPGGKGSSKEWLGCIYCFSLTASALVCLVIWTQERDLTWQELFLYWLGFSAVTLAINQALHFGR